MFKSFVTILSKIPTDVYCGFMLFLFITALQYFHYLPKRYSKVLSNISKAAKIDGDIYSRVEHLVDVIEKEIENEKKSPDIDIFLKEKNKFFIDLLEKVKMKLYDGDFAGMVDIINYDTVVKKHGYRYFASLMPGIFTGLGILGTFLGLVGGLEGLDFSNSSALEGGMKVLISGMSLAFVTSVVGITLSIFWSIIDRSFISGYKRSIEIFNNIFEKDLEEPRIYDLLNEIKELEEEQKNSINTLASDISLEVQNIMEAQVLPYVSDTLVKVLDEGIVSKLDRSFDRIIGEAMYASESSKVLLEKFVDAASENQIDGLNRVVKKFIDSMNSALEGRFEALASSIDEMISWQNSMTENVEGLLKDIGNTSLNIKEINNSVEDTILRFSEYFGNVSNANNKLLENISLIESMSKNTTKLIEDASYIFDDLIDEKSTLESQKDEYIKLMEGYTSEVSQKVSELQRNWSEVSTNLNNLNSGLQKSMGEFGEKTHSSLEQSFDVFDKELAKITIYLDSTISEIRSSVAELPKVIMEFKKSLDVTS